MANEIGRDASQQKMKPRRRGIFLNTAPALCSIYESGKAAYECLRLSENYSLDYKEISPSNSLVASDYDFYLFNYHWVTMGWLDTASLSQYPGLKFTLVLEVSPKDPFSCVSPNDFDGYVVLDPTCIHHQKNAYAFPRPLDILPSPLAPFVQPAIPTFGTFGISFEDKGFDEVVRAVNAEFTDAVVRINIPKTDNADNSDLNAFLDIIKSIPVGPGIHVEITHHHFDKWQLIDWCSKNSANVFLYNRRIGNGLSATTDQAVVSGRPVIISTNPTFRHIHTYVTPYPYQSLKDSLQNGEQQVKRMQEDWSIKRIVEKFDAMLSDYPSQTQNKQDSKTFQLPIKTKTISLLRRLKIIDFVPPIIVKIKRKLLSSLHPVEMTHSAPLTPFTHNALHSFSQFHEDLLIDLLLGQKDNGFYIDVGANDPDFNSNTQKFYLRGWSGINLEPHPIMFKKLNAKRPRDTNLNLAIAEQSGGNLTFYLVGDDSSISTLDRTQAERMSNILNLNLSAINVEAQRLDAVLEAHAGSKKIDFLSVDAEGFDLAVLRSNDWNKFRPTVVLVESNLDARAIEKFMDSKQYIHVFNNHVNILFVDKLSNEESIRRNIRWGEN